MLQSAAQKESVAQCSKNDARLTVNQWDGSGAAAMSKTQEPGGTPITIKKYANRRLYNTATSSYVTLDDLCHMVQAKQDFVVYDAKSGEDITRSVLTQIIVEEESKGQHLLPISFLRQLIAYYGDSLQALVPRYLEESMRTFAQNQEQMRSYLHNAFEGVFPFGSLEEMGKQNMAMMEKAMQMFSPFAQNGAGGGAKAGAGSAPAGGGTAAAGDALEDLQKRLEALRNEVEALSRSKRGA
jgi:polyhydroxyalkanoate synthesis repressor PhaR